MTPVGRRPEDLDSTRPVRDGLACSRVFRRRPMVWVVEMSAELKMSAWFP